MRPPDCQSGARGSHKEQPQKFRRLISDASKYLKNKSGHTTCIGREDLNLRSRHGGKPHSGALPDYATPRFSKDISIIAVYFQHILHAFSATMDIEKKLKIISGAGILTLLITGNPHFSVGA